MADRQVDTLADPEASLEARISAAKALGTSRDPRALDALADVANLTSEELRAAAVDSLRRLGAPAVLAARLTSKKATPAARVAAADALRHLKDPATVPALIEGLRDADEPVRRASAHALAVFGADRAEAPLTAALADESSDVRYLAAIALGTLRTPTAREALRARLGVEKDDTVRDELERQARR